MITSVDPYAVILALVAAAFLQGYNNRRVLQMKVVVFSAGSDPTVVSTNLDKIIHKMLFTTLACI